jgi:hypothetical protein
MDNAINIREIESFIEVQILYTLRDDVHLRINDKKTPKKIGQIHINS